MRRAVFALLVLCSAAAAAQVTISDEVVSDPLPLRRAPELFAASAVALAQDHAGTAVAWTAPNGSGGDRLYVARLNAAGKVAGAVHQIPLVTNAGSTIHQIAPALATAPGGDGFFIAWQEIDQLMPSRGLALVARLDASLDSSAPHAAFNVPISTATPMLVGASGEAAWAAVNGWAFPLGPDGSFVQPLTATLASDMTVADNRPQFVGGRSEKGSYRCAIEVPGCDPGHGFVVCAESCRIYSFTYSLDFTALYSTSQTKTFSFGNDAQPAIAGTGSDVLVAWLNGDGSSGGNVLAIRLGMNELARFGDAAGQPIVLGTFAPDFGPTRPSIATDGQRYLVAWRVRRAAGNHDVVAAAVDRDGKITPLTIAASDADERDPAVLYVGGGSFLVGYEKTIGIERRLAGRFVTFGRKHAAR